MFAWCSKLAKWWRAPGADCITASHTVGFIHQDLMMAVFPTKLIKPAELSITVREAIYFPLSSPTGSGLWFRASRTRRTFIMDVNISVERAGCTAGAEIGVYLVYTLLLSSEILSSVTFQRLINCFYQYLCSIGLCPHSNEITGNNGTFGLLYLWKLFERFLRNTHSQAMRLIRPIQQLKCITMKQQTKRMQAHRACCTSAVHPLKIARWCVWSGAAGPKQAVVFYRHLLSSRAASLANVVAISCQQQSLAARPQRDKRGQRVLH